MGAARIVRQWAAAVNDMFGSPHGHTANALACFGFAMCHAGHCHSGRLAAVPELRIHGLQPDGSFRFDVLKPGRYTLTVHLRERDANRAAQEDVASGAAEFTVPELKADRQFVRDPVDAGAITLTPAPRAIVGSPAPAFRAQPVDGKPVSLGDYRGRFLLVQFRHERLQNGQSAGLRKAHDAFAQDPRVALLSVHVDTDARRLRRLTATEALPWPQALAERGGNGTVSPAYLAGPAMIFVIDPDGLLAAKVLKADDAEAALAKAMLERP
jgi:hypothetical protein